MRSDRELLLGLLALQCGFISKDQLVTAFSLWTSNKGKSLETYLVETRAISESQRKLLFALVLEHLLRHDNDPEKSLAAISSLPPIRSELEIFDDPELRQSLTHVRSGASHSEHTAHHGVDATRSTLSYQGTLVPGSRFRILRPHAIGGLGQVSVALDEELKREVAFKEIKPEYAGNDESRQRFVREAEITGALEHPSIVPIYGLGTYDDGRPYYAMRFIKGDSLRDWITRFHKNKDKMPSGERALAIRQLLSRFVDVCQAMHYAHSRGILHRDLKPHNVMLGKYGETLVVDWGLAKTLGDATPESKSETTLPFAPKLSGSNDMTIKGVAIGTPAYMSPEQAAGKIDELGPASDIYSLGVTLYQCITGKVPFEQELHADVLEAVKKGEYPRPRDRDSTIPKPLEAICEKTMSSRPMGRYASAKLLADDIEHFLADEPVTAHHESPMERVTRFSRKHRSATHTAVVSLLLVCILLGASTWIVRGQREAARLLATNNEKLANEKSKLATDKTRLAEERDAQAMSLRRELARSAFQYGLSIYNSRARKEGTRELVRAISLCRDDPELSEAFMRVILDRLAVGGRGLTPPLEHTASVNCVAFSPDGRHVVTASRDRTAQKWDAETGIPVGEKLKHTGDLNCVAFSPDGQCIATASNDGTVQIWDAETARVVGEPLKDPGALNYGIFAAGVNCVTFSPDGRHIAAAFNGTGTARIWNLESRELLGEPLQHASTINHVAFSPDGRLIATASDDGTTRIWEVGTRKPVGKPLEHHGAKGIDRNITVKYVAFSPDGLRIASASDDGTARIWEVETGNSILEQLNHAGVVNCVTFSPAGRHIATASNDRTVQIWDVETGIRVGEPLQHADSVFCVAFSPDGRRLATASNDQTARIWNAESGVLNGAPLKIGHEYFSQLGFSQCIAFSPDGRRIAVASEDKDGAIQILDTASGKPIGAYLKRFDGKNSSLGGGLSCVVFSPDGRRVAAAFSDGIAQLWNVDTGTNIGETLIYPGRINCIAFSPDGQRVATAAFNEAQIWDAGAAKPLGAPLKHVPTGNTEYSGGTNCVVFSPDGRTVATACGGKTAQNWDTETGKPVGEPLNHAGFVNWVAYSSDGQHIATASKDGTAQIWDAKTGKAVGQTLQHRGAVHNLAFSPNRRRIVTASADTTARIWSSDTGNPIGDLLMHGAGVLCASFSPDGRRIATASADGTARIWDAETGTSLGEPLRHGVEDWVYRTFVNNVIFSVDGRRVATASSGMTRIWNVAEPPMPKDKYAWLEKFTGYGITDGSTPSPLPKTSKSDLSAKLERDEVWIKAMVDYREQAAHYAVNRAESDHHHFAAAFHLNQLLKTHPEDADLKSRLASAEKFLPNWRLDFNAYKAEIKAAEAGDWTSAISLLEELASHYPTDESIAARLKKTKEELARRNIPPVPAPAPPAPAPAP